MSRQHPRQFRHRHLWAHRHRWLALALLSPAAAGCAEEASEEPAVAAIAMLEGALDGEASYSTDQVAHDRGFGAGRIAAACDPDPDLTKMDACGREVPGALDFAWQDCALDESDGPAWLAHATTSGTLGVRSNLVGDCGDPDVSLERSAEFAIDLSPGHGMQASLEGSVETTIAGVGGDAPVMATHLSLRREASRGDRQMTATVDGDLVVTMDEATGTRTTNGLVSMAMENPRRGNLAFELELAGVVRDPACAWPTAGTATRSSADGESVEIVLGPECGEATIDGREVTLDEVAALGGGGRRHGRP